MDGGSGSWRAETEHQKSGFWMRPKGVDDVGLIKQQLSGRGNKRWQESFREVLVKKQAFTHAPGLLITRRRSRSAA